MPHQKHRSVVLVFQYFMIFVFLLGSPFTGYVLGQYTPTLRSKSAKSLTIFQPGDAVRIQIWELYEENQQNFNLGNDFPIDPEGYIVMPLLGEIRVRGLTVFELSQLIQEKLKEFMKSPYVLVRPLIRVTMHGAFGNPGSYLVDPASSLWTMVAAAGGPGAGCDLKRLYVERGGKTVINKLLDAFEKGVSLEEVGIESGDQIVAPTRSNFDLGMVIGIINLLASFMLLYLRLSTGTW